MTKIVTAFIMAFVFVGCSSSEVDAQSIVPKLVVNKNLENLGLKDQFEKSKQITNNTKTVILAFSKDGAHICNDYFATQKADFLETNHTFFIADVSAAPSLIRSIFIMPGLKEFKHKVMILDTKEIAANYRAGFDDKDIVVVKLDNHKIKDIKTISTKEELIQFF